MNGLDLFARYALPPNILGYCGPSNFSSNRSALLKFEGAVPYLRLIAQANNIEDEFDERVVEAYWLGNDLLRNVSDKNLYNNIEERFGKKMKNKDWRWLVSESVPWARPHHVFHVFDVYRRAGLMRSGSVDKLLETIDKCRIGWGTVRHIQSGKALVERASLEFKEKKLRFCKETVGSFLFLDTSIKISDNVSTHWDYVCDKITPQQKANLAFWTQYHLELANKTI